MRPQVRRGYPLNLSISISGGKETNKDSLSNGEPQGDAGEVEEEGDGGEPGHHLAPEAEPRPFPVVHLAAHTGFSPGRGAPTRSLHFFFISSSVTGFAT